MNCFERASYFRPTELVGYDLNTHLPILNINPLDKGDYPAILSMFNGIARSLISVVHSVYHLAACFFDFKNIKSHIYQVGIGALNFLRGLVAVIPIVGNAILFYVDARRLKTEFQEKYPLNNWGEPNNWTIEMVQVALLRGNDLSNAVQLKPQLPNRPL